MASTDGGGDGDCRSAAPWDYVRWFYGCAGPVRAGSGQLGFNSRIVGGTSNRRRAAKRMEVPSSWHDTAGMPDPGRSGLGRSGACPMARFGCVCRAQQLLMATTMPAPMACTLMHVKCIRDFYRLLYHIILYLIVY
jgi:hypothetical protein